MLEKCSFCKPFETIDDMKLDCSSDIDWSSETGSSSENTYSSSKVDVTFKDAVETLEDDIKHWKSTFTLTKLIKDR